MLVPQVPEATSGHPPGACIAYSACAPVLENECVVAHPPHAASGGHRAYARGRPKRGARRAGRGVACGSQARGRAAGGGIPSAARAAHEVTRWAESERTSRSCATRTTTARSLWLHSRACSSCSCRLCMEARSVPCSWMRTWSTGCVTASLR